MGYKHWAQTYPKNWAHSPSYLCSHYHTILHSYHFASQKRFDHRKQPQSDYAYTEWGNSIRGPFSSRGNSTATGRSSSDSPSPEPSSPSSHSALPVRSHFFIIFFAHESVWIWSDLKRLIQLIDYLILIYNCRRRSEKVRLCSEAQEVWNFIPNLIYCYYDFVTLDSNIRIIALCVLMYAYSNRFLNQQTSRIYFITDSEYCFAN